MNEPIVEPILAVESESSFKINAPLIPRDSVAGRALVVVIAIMTFLACLTAGAALLVADASQAWRSDVLRQATIQVKADHIPVVARTASPAEKPRLWLIMATLWPNYDAYQARTERVIPLVILTPALHA